MQDKIKLYYSLTKPGVTYGNAITAVAGFLFAAGTEIEVVRFLGLTVGITLVIASACVINNFLDQDIDALMERTKTRALVEGKVPGRAAVVFSILLGIIGVGLLYAFTNTLTAWIAIFGWVAYVVLYGMLAKRLSIHGTLVGSISGAVPILAGYTAVTGRVDLGGILLFTVLFLWQMPEFYSIAVYRRAEYAKAKVPVMSVVKGIKNTKMQILVYTIFFVVATLLLSFYGYTGYVYTIVMVLLGIRWIWIGVEGQRTTDDNAWAKRMFKFSLVVLLVFSGLISVEVLLP